MSDQQPTLQAMQDQFNLPGKVAINQGQGGLPRLVITTPLAVASVYLHGAHVASYQPRGSQPVIFMSEKSWFEKDKPIRGGVPICFPWFGPKADNDKAPAHGFARLRQWHLQSVDEEKDGSIVILLTLKDDASSRALWPHAFELGHRITIGKSLTMSLEMRNTSLEDYTFEEALHTYFTVKDIARVTVTGLEKTGFFSKVEGGSHPAAGKPVEFVGETDRIYESTADTAIVDPGMGRKIRVDKKHSRSTVVWNPWINKAKAMPDFGDNEWPGMVCVETANVQRDAVALAPGQRHVMSVTISLEPL